MGLFLNETHEMVPLIINSMGNDLTSRSEQANALALTLIANIGSRETAEQLAIPVQNLLVAAATKTVVKKKAALCLLHLYRKNQDCLVMTDAQQKIIGLLEFPSFGFLTALLGLLLGIVDNHREGFEPAVPKVIEILSRIVGNRDLAKVIPWRHINLQRYSRAIIGVFISQCTEPLAASQIT